MPSVQGHRCGWLLLRVQPYVCRTPAIVQHVSLSIYVHAHHAVRLCEQILGTYLVAYTSTWYQVETWNMRTETTVRQAGCTYL